MFLTLAIQAPFALGLPRGAEAQSKVDKKRDKQERKILDTQERAFWDVYRPPPGCINTTELDIKKVCKLQNSPPALDDLR